MAGVDDSALIWTGTELTAPAKFALLAVVDDYVHGNVLRTASGSTVDEGMLEEVARFADEQDPRDVFAGLLGRTTERERFRHGLSMLLDGAAHRLNLSLPGQ